ncbi:MAG TPA: carboxypeptidase-like regulatory domain-containing protein, partial [Vicinamibacterales bacterium]
MSRWVQRAFVMMAALLLAAAASAQVDRATLTGVVRDASDAVLPKARVTVTSLATGVATTVTTSNEGVYLVLNLMPGDYLVQAEATGFQRFEQTVSLELGARSRLDLSLAVGSIGETVKVEGITPLLSTESAVVGTVVDTMEMD